MIGKRTGVDFSKHELTVTQYDGVLIHKFKKPDTVVHQLIFINACGVMTVTGDWGNWVFCREFHPSAKGYVSAGYWDEKLEISSQQESHQYDADATLEAIKQFKKDFKDYYGRKMNEEEKEWVESLKSNVYDEVDYTHQAYRETPRTIDYEAVPFGKARERWLETVYDGFDAICEKMKQTES